MKEGKQSKGKHLYNSLKYIANPLKTQGELLIGGLNCRLNHAFQDMMDTKKQWNNLNGRQGYHVIISLKPGEGSPELAHEIMRRFAEEYLKDDYEGVFATHDDQKHIHSHLVFNSVSRLSGKKYHYKKGDWAKEIQPIVNKITAEYNLSIMVNLDGNNTPYNVWKAEKEGKTTWKEIIQQDIDVAAEKSHSFGNFLMNMEECGYEVKYGKNVCHLAFKPYGADKFFRDYNLGDQYTEAAIRHKIDPDSEPAYLPPLNRERFKRYGRRLRVSKLKYRYYRHRSFLHRLQRPYHYRFDTSYKYRKEIFRMDKLQQQMDYLQKNKIDTTLELEQKIQELKKQDNLLTTRRVQLHRKMKRYKPAFSLLKKIKVMNIDCQYYANGDEHFKPSFEKKEMLMQELIGHGFSDLNKLNDSYQFYQECLKEIQTNKAEIARELRICEQIKERSDHAFTQEEVKQREDKDKNERGKNIEYVQR